MSNEGEEVKASDEAAAPVDGVVMRWKHDCDDCIPLGQDGNYDFYYCPNETTVVARFGPLGDYKSGLWAADLDAALGTARDMVIEHGLLDA